MNPKTKRPLTFSSGNPAFLYTPNLLNICFLKTMVNRIPFFGFNISLCFYPLKEKKSIRRVIFGCSLRNLGIRYRKRPRVKFPGGFILTSKEVAPCTSTGLFSYFPFIFQVKQVGKGFTSSKPFLCGRKIRPLTV